MAKITQEGKKGKREKPFATVAVRVFDNHTECVIENFDKLSVGLIERRVVNAVRKEWNALRRQAVYKARDKELKARQASKIEAEENREATLKTATI